MKPLLIISILVELVLGCIFIRVNIKSGYEYNKNYSQFWSLADKSSTIAAKRDYVEKFVAALEDGYSKGKFASYNAIWLETPDNSFEENLNALRTLSQRLNEIQDMEPTSFEYNTAIQQITAQEQGEAAAMLGVFSGCFELSNYPLVWNWIGMVIFMFLFLNVFVIVFIGGLIIY